MYGIVPFQNRAFIFYKYTNTRKA